MPEEPIELTAPPPIPFDVELSHLTIGPELTGWLESILNTARRDHQPRDFAERHLVDELAFAKWRLLRVYEMEKAVYDHQSDTFRPKPAAGAGIPEKQPLDDFYHLAQA